MSRKKLQARDKLALKMTKDGLEQKNLSTGETERISKRDAVLDLRETKPAQQGFRNKNDHSAKKSTSHKQSRNHDNTATATASATASASATATDNGIANNSGNSYNYDTNSGAANSAVHNHHADHDSDYHDSHDAANVAEQNGTFQDGQNKPVQKLRHEKAAANETAKPPASRKKAKQKAAAKHLLDSSSKDGDTKASKLQFLQDETTPPIATGIPKGKQLAKAEKQMERTAEKLEKAKENLPSKRKLQKTTTVDPFSGKAGSKLKFEKTPKSQGSHIKGSLPLRPAKMLANTAIAKAHTEMFKVEHENVGIKAGHRAEMAAEGMARSALRFKKTAPYRKVAKLEKQAHKKSINLSYKRTLAENPKIRSNAFSRMMQKHKIKRNYAKAARHARKTAATAKKAGLVRRQAFLIRRNPKVVIIIGLAFLLLVILISCLGAVSGLLTGDIAATVASTYIADDADMLGAEADYANHIYYYSNIKYTAHGSYRACCRESLRLRRTLPRHAATLLPRCR